MGVFSLGVGVAELNHPLANMTSQALPKASLSGLIRMDPLNGFCVLSA